MAIKSFPNYFFMDDCIYLKYGDLKWLKIHHSI